MFSKFSNIFGNTFSVLHNIHNFYVLDKNERSEMAAAIAVFALSYMVCSVLADVGSFPNYTLKLKENDNPSCSNGMLEVLRPFDA